MDYASLRAAALRDGEDEEAVTVDTRALIDKVLARYSGEWTTLRELIQNAADAQATTVIVKWETIPSIQVPVPNATSRSELLKHALANHTLRRLVVQNDGQPFTRTDWGRLKRIAEGNPDETKIGAFGVGFYSVFADCEEPFVSSGSEAMAFYWKGNSLFTKKSHIPDGQASRNTAFVLDYRNTTTPLPNLLSVCQFLATSLTFVALQNIEFWIDDYQILSLKKKSSPPADLTLPRDLEARTKEGLMKVIGVDRTRTQIDASYMSVIGWKPRTTASNAKNADTYVSNEASSLRSFFARLTATASQSGLRSKAQSEDNLVQPQIAEDVTKLIPSSIFLSTTSAAIRSNVSSAFASELERATKKLPPKTTKISVLTASYDETVASGSSAADAAFGKATDVFASVLPNKKPGGRIFIGFPTMQTTGAGMHVSAPSVIPTVEREAIDLNARWVRTWNVELLRAAGIVTRLAFSNEMSDLSRSMQTAIEHGKKFSGAAMSKFMPEALHILNTFTFSDSTPSSQVAQIMEEAFWTCFNKASIEMFSNQGVLQTTQVRLGSDELNGFVESIPVIPEEMKSSPFVRKLIDFDLVSHITVTDVKKELEAKALSKSQMIKFISWAGKKSVSGELDPGSRAALLEVAVATMGDEESQGDIVALGSISNYLSPSTIPAHMPTPPTTVPFPLTANTHHSELQALGWEPLQVLPWFRYLLETTNNRPDEESVTKSSRFAVQVLVILSKSWDTLSSKDKATLAALVQGHAVIPTKLSLKRPGESFFSSVKLFDDLPVIQGCEKVKDKFLAAVGVRKTVDLETIFTRLLAHSGDSRQKRWSHMELIKYLASVQNDIPSDDLKKLRETRFCPAEAGPKGMEPTEATKSLYQVCELFEPKEALRALRLPILQWPGPPGSFRASSPEGRFLTALGLRAFPSVPELVEMMASKDEALRTSSMTYFIANHHINRYGVFNMSEARKAILPLQGSTQLVAPSACFTNERAAVLGFHIFKRDLHDHANKFGVARDPPMVDCVNRLLTSPPKDRQSATTLFSYFASRITEVRENSLVKLRNAPIVPASRPSIVRSSTSSSQKVSYVSPSQAYLGKSATYGDIFDFVDFGQEANSFLFHCGAKSEPTKPEVAHMTCAEPARLLSVLQSPERYMDLLKSLAEASSTLHRDKELWRKLKTAPCLLAYKEMAPANKGDLIDLDEVEAPIKQYQLASASRIVVVDDIISYRLFKDYLVCAPEEDALETFYLQLGAEKLSSVVQEDVRIGPHTAKQKKAEQLRKRVVERSKIFLFEYASYRRDAVKHDAKWLEKNLRVEMVRSVALRRTLKGQRQSHTEKRSAAGAYEDRAWVLYVADDGQPDMYQVGQAVCQMLLNRPNQQAYLFFEPFLALDLFGLRARGYNVDRILRAKAAEARIAEEERRKALQEEQRRIQEREQDWAQQGKATDESKIRELPSAAEAARQVARTPEQPAKPTMPGAWGSPDDAAADSPQQSKKGGGLFSNLSRRLGFDSQDGTRDDAKTQLEQFMGNTTTQGGTGSTTGAQEKDTGRPQQDDGRVTSPAVVQQNLLNAVQATRAHGSDHVFSEPKVNQVKEQATYCDQTPAQHISFAAESSNGMKVYVAKSMQGDAATFLSANIGPINSFSSLLVEIGSVYSLSPSVLHIFYDESGGTIAFNTGGSIFCNFRFFLQLHSAHVQSGSGKAEAATWWWVVLAHELAHNLVSPHNSDHSYYTESFIQQYMAKMVAKVTQIAAAGHAPAVPPPPHPPRLPANAASAQPEMPPPPPYTPDASQTG
ncbi:Neutral zinc metallopeptidase [Metarhizium album ARSEF 1941]|uniref:Neutral zinc metallopeptidase n=1 Tax=Metarhizium album (strain ARSEF 1941) TaxID=1081103 RepID=A0A0B2X4E7_METAS|nr:Neutral zinc metallopeptidase [Metarhizium album ARSEF 1941]KHO00285.1 Neutral zinc metallopeptidase [Metarhizium album ARSEF 1941]